METIEELEYRLLRNFIEHMPKVYRKRNANCVIVQEFLQAGTSKAGRTSSIEKCASMGLDPWGYTLEIQQFWKDKSKESEEK